MKHTFLFLVALSILSSWLWSTPHQKQKPYLGITTSTLRNNIKQHLNLPKKSGVMIEHVFKNSAADRANLQKGNILVRINEEYINSPSELMQFIHKFKVGDSVDVEMMEEGRLIYTSVELGERPAFKPQLFNDQFKKHLEKYENLNFEGIKNLKFNFDNFKNNFSGNGFNNFQFDFKSNFGSGNFDFKNFNLDDIKTHMEVIPFDPQMFKSHIKVSGNQHNIEVEHGEIGELNKVIVLDHQGKTLVNSSNIKQLDQLPEDIRDYVQKVIEDVQISLNGQNLK